MTTPSESILILNWNW